MSDPSRVDWCLLTSANLSKAAWGVLQSVGDPAKASLKILSFELGVLFFNDASSAPAGSRGAPLQLCPLDCRHHHVQRPLLLPLPYCLPPTHYAADEAPWTVDGVFTQPDSVGRQWPCAHCAQQPATKPSCLYGPNASAKTLDESRVV